MKKSILLPLMFIAFCSLLFVPRPVQAQVVVKQSKMTYYFDDMEIRSYSQTIFDYYTTQYYYPGVESYLLENGNIVDAGYTTGYNIARVDTGTPYSAGTYYDLIGYHYAYPLYSEFFSSCDPNCGPNAEPEVRYEDPLQLGLSEAGDYGYPKSNPVMISPNQAEPEANYQAYHETPGSSYTRGIYTTSGEIYLGRTFLPTYVTPPFIDNISPSSGAPGETVRVTLSGEHLGVGTGNDTSARVELTGTGITTNIVSIRGLQIVVDFQIASNAASGERQVTQTDIGCGGRCRSNPVIFRVADRTPQITGISPPSGQAGSVIPVTITGSGFGSNPSVSANGGINVTVNSASDTQINTTFSIPSTTPRANYTVTVTSRGSSGSGFIAAPGASSSTQTQFGVTIPGVTFSPGRFVVSKGGTVSVTATVDPPNNQSPITVSIRRISGGGMASFASSSPTTFTTTQTLQIEGVTESSEPDNMELVAKVGTTDVGSTLFTVATVKFEESAQYNGYDDSITPASLMVPEAGSNTVKATVIPSGVSGNFRFESAVTAIATVSPITMSGSSQVLTVTGGTTLANAEIRALPSGTSSTVLATFEATVRRRRNRTLAIHAITEQNDDVQSIPIGRGLPNQVCIRVGTNKSLDTTPQGDDVLLTVRGSDPVIHTGADGICNTPVALNSDGNPLDDQFILVGNGLPNTTCVTQGANMFRDTNTNGDDTVRGNDITSGGNGVCETIANNTNLVPTRVPDPTMLQAYLNDVWGNQANVFFTVTQSDQIVNYDLDRNGIMADNEISLGGNPDEPNAISMAAKTAGVNYNMYYMKAIQKPVAFTLINRGETWLGDVHPNSTDNITAHEVGHLLGQRNESNDPIDVMLSFASPTNPRKVKKLDLDQVNPQTP